MTTAIKKEERKKASRYRIVYYLGFLMVLIMFMTNCNKEDIDYATPWTKGIGSHLSYNTYPGRDGFIDKNVSGYDVLFLVPPDTVNLSDIKSYRRGGYFVYWAFEFSKIQKVDNEHVSVPTSVSSYRWVQYHYQDSSFVPPKTIYDSLLFLIPTRSIYNVKENRDSLIIPAGSTNIPSPKVRGTLHIHYNRFAIFIKNDSIAYKINVSIGFTSDDQKVKLANVANSTIRYPYRLLDFIPSVAYPPVRFPYK